MHQKSEPTQTSRRKQTPVEKAPLSLVVGHGEG
jgi:hypothetical protein